MAAAVGPSLDGHAFALHAGHTWELAAASQDGRARLPRAVATAAKSGGIGIAVAEGSTTGDAAKFEAWFARFARDSGFRATPADLRNAVAEFRVRVVRTLFFDGPQLDEALRAGCLALEAVSEEVGASSGGYALDLARAQARFDV